MPATEAKPKAITIRLSPEDHRTLRIVAAKAGMSIGFYMKEMAERAIRAEAQKEG